MSIRDLLLNFRASAILMAAAACSFQSREPAASHGPRKGKTVTVAQSGPADFVGNDNAVLQRAADSLHPGDTLEVGPGTYLMENSLFIPSGVTVGGKTGQTILRKGAGVESLLTEDGGTPRSSGHGPFDSLAEESNKIKHRLFSQRWSETRRVEQLLS